MVATARRNLDKIKTYYASSDATVHMTGPSRMNNHKGTLTFWELLQPVSQSVLQVSRSLGDPMHVGVESMCYCKCTIA